MLLLLFTFFLCHAGIWCLFVVVLKLSVALKLFFKYYFSYVTPVYLQYYYMASSMFFFHTFFYYIHFDLLYLFLHRLVLCKNIQWG